MTAHGFAWATWLAGCAVVGVVLVTSWLVGRSARRWLVPGWDAAAAGCATAGLGSAWFVLVTEVLGLLDLLTRPGIAVGFVVTSGAALVALRGRAALAPPVVRGHPLSGCERLLVALLLVAVVAPWAAGTATGWHLGIFDVDSHYYHLAHAARIAQSHSLRSIPLLSPGDGVDYYPLDAELVHALGMVAFRSDVMSLLVNDAALALLLGCGWALGRLRGLAVVAALADVPILIRLEPGSGKNDIVVLAFLALAAVALHRRGALVLGVALGLAAGTKLSGLVPVAVLALGAVVVTVRGRRLHTAAAVLGPALLVGGFFYARAWIVTGTPLPSLDLPVLPGPPLPLVDTLSASILDATRAPHAWSDVFHFGLRLGLGPVWPVVAAVWLLGCTVPLRRGAGRVAQLLAAAALVNLVVYCIQPGSAPGLLGSNDLFTGNLRLISTSLLLALLALACDRGIPTPVLFVGVGVLVVGSLSDRTVVWQQRPAVVPIAIALALVVAAAWTLTLPRRALPALAGLTAAVVVVGGAPLARDFLHQRYHPGANDALALFGWADSVHGARIGVVGYPQTYGYEGADLSNTARYVGAPAPHHGMLDFTHCTAWREALAAGGYGWVVIRPFGPLPEPAARGWTESVPGAEVVLHSTAGEVVRLPRTVTTAGCPDTVQGGPTVSAGASR